MIPPVYNDKNGLPLHVGDRVEGKINFDTVQGTVVYDPSGFSNYDHWFIEIDKYFKDGLWKDHYKYRLYLGYHVDEKNNCLYYQITTNEIRKTQNNA